MLLSMASLPRMTLKRWLVMNAFPPCRGAISLRMVSLLQADLYLLQWIFVQARTVSEMHCSRYCHRCLTFDLMNLKNVMINADAKSGRLSVHYWQHALQ